MEQIFAVDNMYPPISKYPVVAQSSLAVRLHEFLPLLCPRAAVYSQLKLRRVAKVTPQRVTTLRFHPSSTKRLVAAGDKRGDLALWDVVSATTSHFQPIINQRIFFFFFV